MYSQKASKVPKKETAKSQISTLGSAAVELSQLNHIWHPPPGICTFTAVTVVTLTFPVSPWEHSPGLFTLWPHTHTHTQKHMHREKHRKVSVHVRCASTSHHITHAHFIKLHTHTYASTDTVRPHTHTANGDGLYNRGIAGTEGEECVCEYDRERVRDGERGMRLNLG